MPDEGGFTNSVQHHYRKGARAPLELLHPRPLVPCGIRRAHPGRRRRLVGVLVRRRLVVGDNRRRGRRWHGRSRGHQGRSGASSPPASPSCRQRSPRRSPPSALPTPRPSSTRSRSEWASFEGTVRDTDPDLYLAIEDQLDSAAAPDRGRRHGRCDRHRGDARRSLHAVPDQVPRMIRRLVLVVAGVIGAAGLHGRAPEHAGGRSHQPRGRDRSRSRTFGSAST